MHTHTHARALLPSTGHPSNPLLPPQVLARDVVYEMVPQDVRRDWHAATAAAMEAYSSGAGVVVGGGGEGGAAAPASPSLPCAPLTATLHPPHPALADQMRLPPSTIAWHWGQSCRDVEAPQWQRSFRAAEWWERAALASVDNGAYADALPLLQKAQARSARAPACWRACTPQLGATLCLVTLPHLFQPTLSLSSPHPCRTWRKCWRPTSPATHSPSGSCAARRRWQTLCRSLRRQTARPSCPPPLAPRVCGVAGVGDWHG